MLTRKNVSGYTLVEAVTLAVLLTIFLSFAALIFSVIRFLLTH